MVNYFRKVNTTKNRRSNSSNLNLCYLLYYTLEENNSIEHIVSKTSLKHFHQRRQNAKVSQWIRWSYKSILSTQFITPHQVYCNRQMRSQDMPFRFSIFRKGNLNLGYKQPAAAECSIRIDLCPNFTPVSKEKNY